MRRLRRLFARHWLKLIGPVVLVVILTRVDVAAVATSLGRADLGLFLLSLPLAWLAIIVRALRWRLLIGTDDLAPPVVETVQYALRSVLFGAATPGRVGELYRLGHVTRLGGSIDRGLASVLADRALDMMALAAIAAACLTLVGARIRTSPRIDIYGIAVFLIGLLILAVAGRAVLHLLARRAAVTPPVAPPAKPEDNPAEPVLTTLLEQIRSHGSGVLAELGRHRRSTWSLCLAMSVVALGLQLWQRWTIARALEVQVPALPLVAVIALAALLSLAPITVNGIGVRDATLVSLLGLYQVSPADAVAVSTLVLATMLTTSTVGLMALILPTATERRQRS